MRALVFAIFAWVTLYAAGLYRSYPLLALFLAEAAFYIVMMVTAVRTSKNTDARFSGDVVFLRRNAPGPCALTFSNKGRFKVSRIKVALKYGYVNGKKRNAALSGEALPGETRVYFDIEPLYSGVIDVTMKSLRVFDPVSFFSLKKRADNVCRAYVVPLLETEGISDAADAPDEQIGRTFRPAPACGDVSKIREYETGDIARYIHWNRYAMTDDVWIKEFEAEQDALIRICVDTKGADTASPKEMGALFDRTASAVGRALAFAGRVDIVHPGPDGETVENAVWDEDSFREAFVTLAGDAVYGRELRMPHERYENIMRISL